MRLHIVQRFGGLLRQQLPHGVGERQLVFLGDGLRLRRRGEIGVSRAGGDHIQRIAQNVRQHDGKNVCRSAELGKASALDGGEPLAQGVDLHDVCAAGQEILGQLLEIRRGDQRLFKQSRAAAGQQEEDGVLRLQPLHKIQSFLGGGKAVFVRNGMPRLAERQVGDGAFAVAVFGDDDAGVDPAAEEAGSGMSHLPCSLARGDQHHPSGAEVRPPESLCHRFVRLCRGNGSGHNGVCFFAEICRECHTCHTSFSVRRKARPLLAGDSDFSYNTDCIHNAIDGTHRIPPENLAAQTTEVCPRPDPGTEQDLSPAVFAAERERSLEGRFLLFDI